MAEYTERRYNSMRRMTVMLDRMWMAWRNSCLRYEIEKLKRKTRSCEKRRKEEFKKKIKTKPSFSILKTDGGSEEEKRSEEKLNVIVNISKCINSKCASASIGKSTKNEMEK